MTSATDRRFPVYSFDIETDTAGMFSVAGLHPDMSKVTSICIAMPDDTFYADTDDEYDLLRQADEVFKELKPGVVTSYGGGIFDVPYIISRIRNLVSDASESLVTSLRAWQDPRIEIKYQRMPGHNGGYRASWGASIHADLWPKYKLYAEAVDLRDQYGNATSSLKPVARSLGIEMIEVDRTKMHLLTPKERRAYCISDAVGTRELGVKMPESELIHNTAISRLPPACSQSNT